MVQHNLRQLFRAESLSAKYFIVSSAAAEERKNIEKQKQASIKFLWLHAEIQQSFSSSWLLRELWKLFRTARLPGYLANPGVLVVNTSINIQDTDLYNW